MKTQLYLHRVLIPAFVFFLANVSFAQAILDQYVKEALASNPAIREKQLLEEKASYRLQQAGKLFGPEVKFITSYTLAAGGRSIDLPIGTLLNDVYAYLNQQIGSSQFPQVDNQTIQFLPNNYYDTRFRITQPILQPEIKYSKLIRQEELHLTSLVTAQSKRELVRNVKTTYLQWMQAQEAIRIIDQGLVLLKENKRITESLIKNGVAIPSGLIRIESEISSVEAQKQKAEADQTNAASYFNFLLHRNADAIILADSFPGVPAPSSELTIEQREELQQIKSGNQIQDLALTLEEKHFAPKLGVQVDIGAQEYLPEWGGYVLGGIQLEIPIWDNHQSKLKRKEWEAGIASTDAAYEWTRGAFETELQAELRSLAADQAIYQSYTTALTSNQRYYAETLRRYKEGLANYIELLDARSQVTQTQLQQNIAKYQAWIRQINIERISASASIQ